MKKIIIAIALLILTLFILRFIPASQQKEVLIKSKIEHVNDYVSYPRNWIKWHPALKAALAKDSTSVQTKEDVAGKSFTFIMPGKEIHVSTLPGLQYHIQESGDNATDVICAFYPDENTPYTKVNYVQQNNLLYQFFPFLQKNTITNPLLASLQHSLEDVRSFYGFDITLQPAEGKAYLVKRMVAAKEKAFGFLPAMFSDIEAWNKKQGGDPAKTFSISYLPLSKDSTEVIAGIALHKSIAGNDSIESMKIPENQFLLVGNYEGVYAKKNTIYTAMALYMMDNNLPQISAFFERFEPGKIPTSDNDIVKMQLCIPSSPR